MDRDDSDTSFDDSYAIYVTEADTTFDDDLLDESIATMPENAQSTRAFVAIWDPANDVLFLSRPNSARGSFLTAKAAPYPPSSISEMQSLGGPSLPPSSRASLCCQYSLADDDDAPCFAPLTPEQRSLKGMTQTSSTLGGLDVYLKGPALSYTHRHQPVYSVLDFSSDFHFDAGAVGLNHDGPEAACPVRRRSGLHLNTTFPQPGLSDDDDSVSVAWSTIESPTVEEIERMRRPSECARPRPANGRRLKKRRPDDLPLSPVKEPNSAEASPPTPPHCMTLGLHKGLLKCLLNIRNLSRRVERDWIWVET